MATITKIAQTTQPEPGTVHWLNQCVERGKSEVFSEVISLNPGLAGELLRRNPDNRGVKPTKVIQYATDMRQGRWTFNGEPVIISQDGMVNDGQHRLNALVDANVCMPMLFVFGLARDTRFTVDQGAARGASDYLGMGGIENASTCATIARLILAYEANDGQSIEAREITNAAIRARSIADPKIAEAAHYAVTEARKLREHVAGTVIGFCYYLFNDINAMDAKIFLGGLCSGSDLKPNSPALTCRDKLLSLGKSRQPKVAVIFRAWNMYRRGVKSVKTNGLITTLPLPALI